jgi:hypothetical protein
MMTQLPVQINQLSLSYTSELFFSELTPFCGTSITTPMNTPKNSRLYERRKSIYSVDLPPLQVAIAPIITVPDFVPPIQLLSQEVKKQRRHSIGVSDNNNNGTPRPQKQTNSTSPYNKNLIRLPAMGASPTLTLQQNKRRLGVSLDAIQLVR